MSIKSFFLCAVFCLANGAQAQTNTKAHNHGSQIFHAFRLDTAIGDDRSEWDLDGWIGSDTDRLWLKSENDTLGNDEDTEYWALYGRNISTFWDAQAGLRIDDSAEDHSFLALGVNGLAPYFFDTQAHIFVRDDGDLSARLRQENDLLITNRLILRPYVELNVSAQDDRSEGLGAGLTSLETGFQTSYAINRQFAPYLDVRFTQKLGKTADYAKQDGENPKENKVLLGLGWLF
jgi:copper resistance protein B